jgi:N-acyl-D-aspartate/D-glutamate deacylase
LGIANGGPEEMRKVHFKLGASDYARERGAEVVALMIPSSGSVRLNMVSGMVFDAFDGWAPFFRLSIPERIEKLRDREYRLTLKKAEARLSTLKFAKWDNLKVAEIFSESNKRYLGRLIADIAAEEGRDTFDVFADIAIADELKTSFMPQFGKDSPELYKARADLVKDSRTVVGASDAGAHLDMIDTFAIPTALLESVRKFKALTLEQAIYQLTHKPAKLMGLRNRGLLKTGWHADIVIFDADKVRPGTVYTRKDMPADGMRLYADAEGIDHVIVNGREIIRHNSYLGVPAGAIIRPGTGTYTVSIPAVRRRSGEQAEQGSQLGAR